MILFGRIEIPQWADLHIKALAGSPLNSGNAFHRLFCGVIGIIHTGLVLTAQIHALPVDLCRIDDVKIGQQQCFQTHLCRVIGHSHRFPESRSSGTDRFVIGICLTPSVGIAALGIQHTGDRPHQMLDSPEAAARQIDGTLLRVFFCMHVIPPNIRRSMAGRSDPSR